MEKLDNIETIEAKKIRSQLFSTFSKEETCFGSLRGILELKGITKISDWLLTLDEIKKWRAFTNTYDVLLLAQTEKALKCIGFPEDTAKDRAIFSYCRLYKKEY